MLEKMTVGEYNRLRGVIEYNCIRKDHFCDGAPMRENVKRTYPCPYFCHSTCTQPNILEVKNTIKREREGKGKI